MKKLLTKIQHEAVLFVRHSGESPVRASLIVLICLSILIFSLSFPYYIHEFDTFYPQLLVEAHGMLFDIAIIGVLIFWLNYRRERRQMIRTYLDEIDDFRLWESEEAAFRTAGNIKRLNRQKIYSLNLADSHISRTNLNYVRLIDTNLNLADVSNSLMIGAVIEDTRLNQTNFAGANLNRASLKNSFANGADFSNAYMINVDLENTYLIKANLEGAVLMEANLRGCDLNGANLKNTNLFKADLRGARGLSLEQVKEAKNLHRAKMDPELLIQVEMSHPEKVAARIY